MVSAVDGSDGTNGAGSDCGRVVDVGVGVIPGSEIKSRPGIETGFSMEVVETNGGREGKGEVMDVIMASMTSSSAWKGSAWDSMQEVRRSPPCWSSYSSSRSMSSP